MSFVVMATTPRFSLRSSFFSESALAALAITIFCFAPLLAQSPTGDKDGATVASRNYRLGPGDVIRVNVLKQDLLTQDGLRIANDGTIRLPLLEAPIQAGCLTEAELSANITEKYRKYILNPQVYVSVKEFNAYSVAVIGAVNTPGRFQLQRPTHLLEILTLVNGLAPTAGKELQIMKSGNTASCDDKDRPQIGVTPDDGPSPEIISIKVSDVLSGNELSNPTLSPGDIVRVVEADVRQAYIIGNVRSATTINLKESVTLSTAIAMAGGVVGGAQMDKIKVTRQTPGSLSTTNLFVNFKEILKGSAEDFVLQPNDIIDVPGPSGTKKVFTDILRTIVPTLSRGAIMYP
jgi:polysaccharide export outer membrane protein